MQNDKESLERIHTFSLKENNEDDEVLLNFPEEGNSSLRIGRDRNMSANSASSSTLSQRSLSKYVPDKIQTNNKQLEHCQKILSELVRIQNDFAQIGGMNTQERN
jgi:hypothetical protein